MRLVVCDWLACATLSMCYWSVLARAWDQTHLIGSARPLSLAWRDDCIINYYHNKFVACHKRARLDMLGMMVSCSTHGTMTSGMQTALFLDVFVNDSHYLRAHLPDLHLLRFAQSISDFHFLRYHSNPAWTTLCWRYSKVYIFHFFAYVRYVAVFHKPVQNLWFATVAQC